MLAELSAADLECIFQDWGQAATLLEVEQRYDAVRGFLEEVRYSTPITVVAAGRGILDQAATAAAAPIDQSNFLMRESELPAAIVLTSARLNVGCRSYVVHRAHPSSLAGAVLLECRGS